MNRVNWTQTQLERIWDAHCYSVQLNRKHFQRHNSPRLLSLKLESFLQLKQIPPPSYLVHLPVILLVLVHHRHRPDPRDTWVQSHKTPHSQHKSPKSWQVMRRWSWALLKYAQVASADTFWVMGVGGGKKKEFEALGRSIPSMELHISHAWSQP